MNILVVHNFYKQAGGEDAVVDNEVELLRSHGHSVTLFGVNNDAIQGVWRRISALLGVVYNFRSKCALVKMLKDLRPDVVHVHNFFPLLSPSIFDACHEVGIPSVLTLHNYRILCPTAILYHDGKIDERSLHGHCWWTVPARVYRNSFVGSIGAACMVEFHRWRGTWETKVDRFIALTEFAKRKFVEGGLPAEKVEVKPNATRVDLKLPFNAKRHGALFVGRLSQEKGIEVLIDAWQAIEYPLRVAGTGPMGNFLDRAGDALMPLGSLTPKSVRSEMEKAAFLVMPSVWYETFGMVIIEAFAAGLPVIASNHGSMSEIVEEGETGLLFRAGDSLDLAAKVRWAVAHPDEMQKMGANARRVYEQKYTAEANYCSLMRVYEAVLCD